MFVFSNHEVLKQTIVIYAALTADLSEMNFHSQSQIFLVNLRK